MLLVPYCFLENLLFKDCCDEVRDLITYNFIYLDGDDLAWLVFEMLVRRNFLIVRFLLRKVGICLDGFIIGMGMIDIV